MGILGWIIIGLLAAAIAKRLVPGEEPGGFLLNLMLGIAGAILGGLIMNLLGGAGITGFNLYSLAVAVLGSSILLFGYHKLKGERAQREDE